MVLNFSYCSSFFSDSSTLLVQFRFSSVGHADISPDKPIVTQNLAWQMPWNRITLHILTNPLCSASKVLYYLFILQDWMWNVRHVRGFSEMAWLSPSQRSWLMRLSVDGSLRSMWVFMIALYFDIFHFIGLGNGEPSPYIYTCPRFLRKWIVLVFYAFSFQLVRIWLMLLIFFIHSKCVLESISEAIIGVSPVCCILMSVYFRYVVMAVDCH